VEQLGLSVVKRDGTKVPWDRGKLVEGIRKALVNRPVTEEQVERLVARVETRLRRKGPEVGSQQIGLEVLQNLQKLDHVGYLRFASVYKDFQEVGDFERELGLLLEKKVPAKRRSP
jgi:transcriptional repressor NrdR